MKPLTAIALRRARPNTARDILFIIVSLSLALFIQANDAQGREPAKPRQDSSHSGAINLEGVSVWLDKRFSDTELAALQPEDFRIESHACSCYDRPEPHFPYLLLLFTTPKGDLVGRPDRRGIDVVITRLAVRHGDRYCDLDAEDQCYGSFSHPCAFSDFRYGPHLAAYFPSCKLPDSEFKLIPTSN